MLIGESCGRDESGDRLWLQAWRQQLLRPGTCSRTWLAFGYVLIRPSRGHKHMQQVLSECTQRPKGQLCAPSVSKRIRISGGAGSCLGSGASPWVIRRGCQGRVRRGGGGWGVRGVEENELLLPLPTPPPPLLLSHSTQTHPPPPHLEKLKLLYRRVSKIIFTLLHEISTLLCDSESLRIRWLCKKLHVVTGSIFTRPFHVISW